MEEPQEITITRMGLIQMMEPRLASKRLCREKIIKGIAGFYYVHVVEFGVYECKAKGVFRKEKIKPLVGDNVEIEILDESAKKKEI